MKILLIEPSSILPTDWHGLLKLFLPIGLGYLASMLEKSGHEVKILDARLEGYKQINKFNDKLEYIGLTYEQIAKRVKKENPQMVGIGGWSVQKFSVFKTAEAIKKLNPKVKIVLGGILASADPKSCLSDPNVDFVIRGEGEYTIVELANELEKKKPNFKKIKGLGYKTNKNLFFNEMRKPIQNLDELPFPAYHLFNMNKYFETTQTPTDKRFKKIMNIVSSRGCPYNCCFCSVHTLTGIGWRFRSPENVVDEIEFLFKKYGVDTIQFWDDNISVSKDRLIKILDLIKERKIDVQLDFPIFRADTLDDELFKKLKESNVGKRIYVAAESGDQEVLDKIVGKRLDLKYIINAVKLANKHGFKIGCYFVIGMPDETKKNIENTYRFSKRIRKMGCHIITNICVPFPSTRVYNQCIESGYLTTNNELEYTMALLSGNAIIKTGEFTPEELYKWKHKIEGNSEIKELVSTILNNPSGTIRTFIAHPRHITRYMLDKYVYKNH